MVYTFIGVIGFVLMYTYDYYNFKNKGNAKKIFGLMGICAMVVATLCIMKLTPKFELNGAVRAFGLVLAIISGGLLCYSLFLELPFKNTYGNAEYNSSLIQTGTYALCRHPGVIWFGMMYFSLFLYSASMTMLFAGIIWTTADVIYVIIQEKVFFHKMFSEYGEYVKSTPMLVPNINSFKRCIKTIK